MFFIPPQMPPNTAPVVTVWVHGTKIDECLPSLFARIAKRVGNIVFQHTPGLHHATYFRTHNYDSIRSTILGTSAPTVFPPHYIYSFGWSGKLNSQSRKTASQELFDGLKSLQLKIVDATGLKPKFIVITHSHGGNVLLHMAEIKEADGFELTISKAILLACPVQKTTSHLISSPMFERIYSLHSHTDMIQILDMQGLRRKKRTDKPFFSERHFSAHPKLIQAHIRWKRSPTWNDHDRIVDEIMLKRLTNGIKMVDYLKKNRGLFHIEFQLMPFLRHLGSIVSQLDDLFDNGSNCPSHQDHEILIEL